MKQIAIGLIWRRADHSNSSPIWQVVVGRRGDNVPLAGYDEFPGGKCENDETPKIAVVRECLEETGLNVAVNQQRAVIEHEYSHDRVRLFFFDCMLVDDSQHLLGSFRWLDVADALELRFPEANNPLLELLRRQPHPY